MPYPLADAIKTALHILSWDELAKDERPPKAIWFDHDRLKAWWEDVERRREERFKGGGSSSGGDEKRNKLTDELIA